MVELKLTYQWKQKIVGWCRDLVIVFGMWIIWLTDVYMPESGQQMAVRIFAIAIIVITILIREYVDFSIISLENELQRLKQK